MAEARGGSEQDQRREQIRRRLRRVVTIADSEVATQVQRPYLSAVKTQVDEGEVERVKLRLGMQSHRLKARLLLRECNGIARSGASNNIISI